MAWVYGHGAGRQLVGSAHPRSRVDARRDHPLVELDHSRRLARNGTRASRLQGLGRSATTQRVRRAGSGAVLRGHESPRVAEALALHRLPVARRLKPPVRVKVRVAADPGVVPRAAVADPVGVVSRRRRPPGGDDRCVGADEEPHRRCACARSHTHPVLHISRAVVHPEARRCEGRCDPAVERPHAQHRRVGPDAAMRGEQREADQVRARLRRPTGRARRELGVLRQVGLGECDHSPIGVVAFPGGESTSGHVRRLVPPLEPQYPDDSRE